MQQSTIVARVNAFGDREGGGGSSLSLFLFRLFGHPLEPLLHLLHLTAKIVDVVFFRRRFRCFLRFGGSVSGAGRRERLEHREGPLEHFHVAANMFLKGRKRRPAEGGGELL